MRKLSACPAIVRANDPDRFLTAIFAPEERREALLVLYAFNHELARAREVASQPVIGLMRLQWWREVVEGVERRHEVATPLAALLAEGKLAREDLRGLIEAREAEADEAFETTAEWLAYIRGTAGALTVIAGRLLAGPLDRWAEERLSALGTAYGVAGVLRNVGACARQGRCMLPVDALTAGGLDVHTVIAGQGSAAQRRIIRELAGEGRALLAGTRGHMAGAMLPAGLVGVLARRDLGRIETAPRERGFGDRWAVARAWGLGWV
jgi:phytoene synthase